MSEHDGIIRAFLGMVVLYKKQNDSHLDLKLLAKKLEEATGEDYSEFYLKKYIAQSITDCPYDDMLDLFYIDVVS